jgi:hypothetical protein
MKVLVNLFIVLSVLCLARPSDAGRFLSRCEMGFGRPYPTDRMEPTSRPALAMQDAVAPDPYTAPTSHVEVAIERDSRQAANAETYAQVEPYKCSGIGFIIGLGLACLLFGLGFLLWWAIKRLKRRRADSGPGD